MMSDSMACSAGAPHVLVATTGTVGDILPFILLAQSLVRRGCRVSLLAPAFHADLLAGRGVDVETFGTVDEVRAMLEDPVLWDERRGFGVIWRGLVPHLGLLRERVSRVPPGERCVLLCHPILVPMADVARAARPDLRVVCAWLAPSNLCGSQDALAVGSMRIPRSMPLSWRRGLWHLVFRFFIDPDTLPPLNAFRAASGLPPVVSFLGHMHGAPDASVGLFPDWFAAAQPDWPAGVVAGEFPAAPPTPTSAAGEPALPAGLARFLDEGDAPVVVTPGTGHRHAAACFEAALGALKRLGRRGVFVTPFAEQVPRELPRHVAWVARAPFETLLPRAAALVHHGGIGTLTAAFRAGIPQVVSPYAFDQFDNGWRARRLGVAEVVLPRRMSARRLAGRLDGLLSSPSVREACARVAALATDPDAPARLDAALGQAIDRALNAAPAPAPAAAAALSTRRC